MTNLSNAEKREIFTEGAWLLHSRYNSFTPYPETREYVEKEALRRYPDPKEPTIVTLSDGRQAWIEGGRLWSRVEPDADMIDLVEPFTISDILALADIAQEYISNTQEKK